MLREKVKVRDFKIRKIRRITWQSSKLSRVKWNYLREETILGNKEGKQTLLKYYIYEWQASREGKRN